MFFFIPVLVKIFENEIKKIALTRHLPNEIQKYFGLRDNSPRRFFWYKKEKNPWPTVRTLSIGHVVAAKKCQTLNLLTITNLIE